MAFVRAGVWILPVRSLLGLLERRPVLLSAGVVEHRPAREKIAWAVGAAARRVPGANCLVRSITAHGLLARYGYDSEICVGVSTNGNAFEAHAWVEVEGAPFLREPALHRFTRLDDLPRALASLRRHPPVDSRPDRAPATHQPAK
jgi:hypothetical protein